MKTVPLGGKKAAGRVALVSDEDYEMVARYRWHVRERRGLDGRVIGGPYAGTKIRRDGRQITVHMHQLITGWPQTDHRNGDGLDNQRHNLRPATTAENNHNQRPQRGTSSRYKGVTWHKQLGKWQAAIKVNGKNYFLGVHVSEEQAALAYNAAALKAYGEYAYLNEVAA